MTRPVALCLALHLVLTPSAPGQRVTVEWGAQAIPTLAWANVVPGDRSLAELRLVQPVAMLHAGLWGGRLRLVTTVNFEKYTLLHGELAPGNWGEGFADRRHPHTVVHELMLVAPDLLGRLDGGVALFLAAGKGFVPFGTDDPMVRPPVRFPVNHHLAQVLERAVAIVGVEVGPVALEAARFNGDEPVSPGSWPAWDRFGDSWAVRLTATPFTGLEGQASYAGVASPENRPGSGLDDARTSISARWDRGAVYALVEWARTSVSHGVFVYHSMLVEAAVRRGRHRRYLRVERTERPEETRRFESLFRTVRPLFDNSILGITRWTTLTVGDGLELARTGPVRVTAFVEASAVGIAKVGGGVFDPIPFYGRERGVTVSLGARLSGGMPMHRMGRYGRAGGMPSHTDHQDEER
ncbi:MAG: hypothetical protein ACREMF_08085 [Gemmatimonadales bacterium]